MDCVSGGAVWGYVAAMLCSRVQVDRPSSATSGGQSAAVVTGTTGALGFLPVVPFIIAIHSAEEVQVRQLELSDAVLGPFGRLTYGLPSLSRTTPGGCLFSGASRVLESSFELELDGGLGNGNDICTDLPTSSTLQGLPSLALQYVACEL